MNKPEKTTHPPAAKADGAWKDQLTLLNQEQQLALRGGDGGNPPPPPDPTAPVIGHEDVIDL